jgi:hypothetical protein
MLLFDDDITIHFNHMKVKIEAIIKKKYHIEIWVHKL